MLRILYNSRDPSHKDPLGTIIPGQTCTLRMKIPQHCQTRQALCRLLREDGTLLTELPMDCQTVLPPYETWTCQFTLEPGLYFYFFRITTPNETFSLLRQGEDTNMEAGDWWQLSCVPKEAHTPAWAQGAIIYQVFPDRFAKSGSCDLTGKLEPYTLHQNWTEEVHWQPTDRGEVLNNDFFGGNFQGITEKLPYIASLGATILYLNPISKAFSSHRYDTGDYKTPDPMLGTKADFVQLCREARRLGIHVILDGVFSHTGSNSLYFDRYRAFGGHGAYADPQSPYRSWYQFYHYPDSYNCWWNFDTLPCVNKMDPSYLDYIIDGPDSVVAHWLRLGADGFRLDVVDELPDEFVLRLKKRVREIKPDALLIGEVWEDASNKIAYDIRRRYFVDGELDGVMNYPYRKAIIDFLRQRDDGKGFRETIMTLAENYPPQVLSCCMNLLGTHDTPRILTGLIDDFEGSREEKATSHRGSFWWRRSGFVWPPSSSLHCPARPLCITVMRSGWRATPIPLTGGPIPGGGRMRSSWPTTAAWASFAGTILPCGVQPFPSLLRLTAGWALPGAGTVRWRNGWVFMSTGPAIPGAFPPDGCFWGTIWRQWPRTP